MQEVARISDQLKRAFQGEAWHGPSLGELLADVSPERAATRPIDNAHSIWEIVLHITAWKNVVRRRLEGQSVRLSDEEDWPRVERTDKNSWSKAVASLGSAQERLLSVLSRLPDSELEGTVPGERYSAYFMLHGVIQHNLYHAGQIALLKKANS